METHGHKPEQVSDFCFLITSKKTTFIKSKEIKCNTGIRIFKFFSVIKEIRQVKFQK